MLQRPVERNIQNSKSRLCDFFDFELIDKFDGVIAFDVFFIFRRGKQTGIYDRVAKWMSAGAYLLFTHGIKEGEISGEMFGEVLYYSSLDRQVVHKLLFDSGLEVVSS